MQYKLVEKANPLKKEEKKWYANPITTRKVGQKELAKEIELQSSLTKGDIGNVIDNLVENLPKHLVNGESVQLGEFGTFRISFSSEGAVDKAKFNTKSFINFLQVRDSTPKGRKAIAYLKRVLLEKFFKSQCLKVL